MGSIVILLHHNGRWDCNNNYTGYQVAGVSVNPDCTYEKFQRIVADHLKVDTQLKCVVMKFQLKDAYPCISIENDVGMEFYKDIKMKEHDYTKFPICISSTERGQNIFSTSMAHLGDERGVTSVVVRRKRIREDEVTVEETPSFIEFADRVADMIVVECASNTNKKTDVTWEDDDVAQGENSQYLVKKGQLFENQDLLKRALSLYALEENFSFKAVKSCKIQYYIGCIDDNCGWFVKSSRVGGSSTFKVRSMDLKHTCSIDIRTSDQRQANAKFVSECIKRKFFNLKTIYTPADIIRDMKKKYGVTLDYKKAWRSRRVAIDEVRGKPDESYQKISRYLKKIIKANPGSIWKLSISSDNNFEFLFMATYAAIKGWHYCRPVVVVDGTFLKEAYGGTLLIASVQDANAHILPLAFAIVDSENDLAYEWFFWMLKEAFGSREGMCIVSDRNESLSKAVLKVYPEAAHCFCTYHLGKNLKKHFKKNATVMSETFMKAAKAYTEGELDKHMKDIENIDPRIVEYLKEVGYDKWARVHCGQNRFSMMTSNIAESVNSALKIPRELPVTTLLECLRALQQKWSVANRDEAKSTFTTLASKGNTMLEENYKMSLRMTVVKASDVIYQVSIGVAIFVVDMQKKVCTCNKFQMDEFPCPHAICVVRGRNEDLIPYWSKYYYKETMVSTYDECVYPVGSESTCAGEENVLSVEVVLPPVGRVRCGRRKLTRRRSSGEYTKRKTCSRCKGVGHNKKTCRNPPHVLGPRTPNV